MQAHGRFKQEAWTYDERTLDIYRDAVLLHEQLVPYITAAAETASRCGLPAIRPLCLTDPSDPKGWSIADSFGLGPSLWVAPVLEEGARSREAYLPRGEWVDYWSGERLTGGRWIEAKAPLGRIPVWVRSGSLLLTYPEAEIARGLGEEDPSRALEATLWGDPPLGHAAARLPDGTRVSWHEGEWAASGPKRSISFAVR
jgi:alpha-glucosidase (family GH31 glycosyl hydrolase)